MKDLKCEICGREIRGEYLQSEDVVVCSRECAREHENRLPYHGKPIQHLSRITGYYQNIEGWNKGKREELKDRRRYDVQ